MAKEYLRPGVFVEEIPSGAYPIEGVGTTCGAFLGVATRGAANRPKLVTNWSQFVKHFGSYRSDSFLAYAVYGFFLNGGRRCFVSRIMGEGYAIANIVLNDRAPDEQPTIQVQALNEGEWGNHISIDIEPDSPENPDDKFKLVVRYDGEIVEEWSGLEMKDSPAGGGYVDTYFVDKINGNSNYIQIADLASPNPYPHNMPAFQNHIYLQGGFDGEPPMESDYIGDPAGRRGLFAFDTVDEINSLAIPGIAMQVVVQAAIDYCEGRSDIGFVADPPPAIQPQDAKIFRDNFDSSYGYCYYPWIEVNDPAGKGTKHVPPSGYVMGIFARSDTERGVHKAPANEVIRGAVGVQYELTDGEQEVLNPAGVNCIRSFPGRSIYIWGARTMSSDPNMRYIHKRRTLMFIEESIGEAMVWAVFEPNDETLWRKITRSCSAFLKRQWIEGALFGASEEEAYYVKCDEETNPPEVRAAGQVITEIGVNVVETAEFVIFRIGLWDGGKEITERR